jgi:hypothetical protein
MRSFCRCNWCISTSSATAVTATISDVTALHPFQRITGLFKQRVHQQRKQKRRASDVGPLVLVFNMGGACVKPRVSPANPEETGAKGAKRSVKGGSVAGGSAAGGSAAGGKPPSAAGGNKSGAAGTYRNQFLQKIKADAENTSATSVNTTLSLDYIRMENKLLEKNIDRVLSMVGSDGRTVRCT